MLARYLGAGERVVHVTRQHPFSLIGQWLSALGLLAPLVLVAWGVTGTEALRGEPADWIVRVCLLGMALVVVRLVLTFVGWDVERIVVTDEKVIHMEGVLHRRIASTPLAKVSEFTVHQPLLGRVFGYGSLVVDVPGGREQALHGLGYVPDPAAIYRLISDVARRGRVQEGGGSDAPGLDAIQANAHPRTDRDYGGALPSGPDRRRTDGAAGRGAGDSPRDGGTAAGPGHETEPTTILPRA